MHQLQISWLKRRSTDDAMVIEPSAKQKVFNGETHRHQRAAGMQSNQVSLNEGGTAILHRAMIIRCAWKPV